jgi:Glycosyl hydrolase family 79 C-terminal beta domain
MVFVRRRAVPAAAVALVVLVALALIRAGGRTSGRTPPLPAAHVTMITVRPGHGGAQVPYGFVGLSLEYTSIEAYAGTSPRALDPVFVQLVRNLSPGQAPVLRIGGDSTDRTWWPAAGLARPPGVTYAITTRWLEVTRALVHALRARLIVGLNLEADRPALAAAEALALENGIGGGAVRAFELGNEPDLYASFPWYQTPAGQHITGRPPNYDMGWLISDFTNFAAALPRRILAGPSLGAPSWTRQLSRFLTAVPQVGLVTLHRYPLQLCYTPRGSSRYPTIPHLLAPASSIGLADSFAPYAAIARSRRLSLRIDELNSVSCGAYPAVSKTFASALWVLDTLFELVRVGVHGVNIHTFPGAGYELFKLRRIGGRWGAAVAPEYYGLMLFERAAPAGSRLLSVVGAASDGVRTWATRTADGTIRIAMINTGRQSRQLSLAVAGVPFARAMLERLTAPSLVARSRVVLAGQSFGARTRTGVLDGRPAAESQLAVRGRYQVALPAASAALLVLSPPGS